MINESITSKVATLDQLVIKHPTRSLNIIEENANPFVMVLWSIRF